MNAEVMIGFHPVLDHHLPVERTLPALLDHHVELRHAPGGHLGGELGELLVERPRRAVQVDEHEALPDFAPELGEPMVARGKALGEVHLRAALDAPIEPERPVVIRTHEHAAFAMALDAAAQIERFEPRVAKARRHDVHAAVRAHPRQHPHPAFAIANHAERLADEVEVERRGLVTL